MGDENQQIEYCNKGLGCGDRFSNMTTLKKYISFFWLVEDNHQIEYYNIHLCVQPQAGVLATSLHSAEKAGKSCVVTEKALAKISEKSKKTLEETVDNMKKQEASEKKDMKLVDVTHTLFEKHASVELPPSQVFIYKGIFSNLMSWGRNDLGGKLCGLLAGDGKTVTDVVICTDFEKCTQSPNLQNRWEDLEVKPMGIAVWASEPDSPVDQFMPLLRALKSPFELQVLVVMFGGSDPSVWDISMPKDGEETRHLCSGSKSQSGRKKDEKYRVVDFDSIGKNCTSDMNDIVSALLRKTLKQKLAGKMQISPSTEQSFEEHVVPADGLCFWHCVLASLDFSTWIGVPRKDSGYATNTRLVKSEEDRARALMTKVMRTAADLGVEASKIEEVMATGCATVEHLPWISKALQLDVRCTISDQALEDISYALFSCFSCMLCLDCLYVCLVSPKKYTDSILIGAENVSL